MKQSYLSIKRIPFLILLFILFFASQTQAQTVYIQDFNTKPGFSARPPCWNEGWGSFSIYLEPNATTIDPYEGIGGYRGGQGQISFCRGPYVMVDTNNWFSFWYAQNLMTPGHDLWMKVYIQRYKKNSNFGDSTLLETVAQGSINNTWKYKKYKFPFKDTVRISIQFGPAASVNRGMVDFIQSDVNINGDGSTFNIPTCNISQVECFGTTKKFKATYKNNSVPLKIEWYLNGDLKQVGTADTFNYSSFVTGDTLKAAVFGKSPCAADNPDSLYRWYSQTIYVADCKTITLTGVSDKKLCRGESFNMTYTTLGDFTSLTFAGQLSTTKTFGSATQIGTGASPMACTIPAGQDSGKYYVRIRSSDGTYSGYDSVHVYVPNIASAPITDVKCNGASTGAITVNPAAGSVPYTYSWSTTPGVTTQGISNQYAGNYTVTVRDANTCSVTATYAITQPSALTLSGVITHINCNGGNNGAVTITPGGGVTTYTYSWSTTPGVTTQNITGRTYGTYTVTVTDANLCTITGSYTITQPTAVAVSGVMIHVSCNGGNNGSIDITPSNGTPGYTYSWNTGETSQDRNALSNNTYNVTVFDSRSCTATASYSITHPVVLGVTGAITHVSCNTGSNGAVTITVTGGTTTYSYSWSSGVTTKDITGRTSDNYTVTITDAKSCTLSSSFNITQPTAISITQNAITHVSCNGGSNGGVDINVSGGTGGYTYTWSAGSVTTQDISGRTNGTYTVTVTDGNSCTKSASFGITQPTALSIPAPTITHVNCNGGSGGAINIAPTGGTIAYTYSWSTSATSEDINSLGFGTYTVTVRDANTCTVSGAYNVTQPTALTLSGAITAVSCNGGNNGGVDINVSGGNGGYTYSWSTTPGVTTQDITGRSFGNYTVTITDVKSCTLSSSFNITQPTAISITQNAITQVSCNGGSNGGIDINVSGGTGGYTYSWNTTPGVTTQDITSHTNGTYTITVTDGNSCTKTASFVITQPTAISIPAPTITHVNCNGGNNGAININPTGGISPFTYSWSDTTTSQNLSGVKLGNYTVTVTDANLCTRTASYNITQPTALTASNTITHVSCNGLSNGAVTVTAGGGTSGYTYSWSSGSTTNSISGQPLGTYTITITDAHSCTRTNSYSITQPAVLALSYSLTHVLIFGQSTGAINLTVSGGTTGYTYSWSNGATSQNISAIPSGSYNVTVTDSKSCSIIGGETITQPGDITVTPSYTHVSCNGGNNGAISLVISGGVTPYTYTWSTGANSKDVSGLSATLFTVTVRDAVSATSIRNYTITQPTLITFTNSISHVNCNGENNGSIDVSPTGGVSPYTYLWSNGNTTKTTTTTLVAGNFTVTITDSQLCTKTGSFTVTQPNVLTVTATTTALSCFNYNDGKINTTVSGGTPTYSYSWSNASTSNNLSSLTPTSYTVTITDNHTCTATGNWTITEPAKVPTNAGLDVSVCLLDSITLTATGGVSYVWSTGKNSNSIKVSPNDTTTFYVTATDANSCFSPDSVVVNVLPLPNASLTLSYPAICFGDMGTITLNNSQSGINYQLRYDINDANVGSPVSGNGSNISFNYTTPNDTLYNILATNATTSCKVELTNKAAVVVNDLPTTTGNSIDSNLINTSSNLTLTTTAGSGSYRYVWSPADSLITGNDTLANPTTIKLRNDVLFNITITDKVTSCVDTAQLFVNVYGSFLKVDAYTTQVSDSSICLGDMIRLRANATGGSGTYSYSWTSKPVGFFSKANDTTYIPSDTAWYILKVNDGFNTVYDSLKVVVKPLPNAYAGLDTTTCSGDPVNLVATGGISYAWSNGVNTATNLVNTLDTTAYTVTVTSAQGCINTDAVNVFAKTRPIAEILIPTKDTFILYNASVALKARINNGGAGKGYTYLWQPGGIYLKDSTFLNVNSNKLTETKEFKFTVSDNFTTCSSTDSITILVGKDPLRVNFVTTPAEYDTNNKYAAICIGNDIKISAIVNGGTHIYNYRWWSSPAGYISASGIDSVVIDTPNVTTNYFVEVTDGNDTVYDQIRIEVLALPVPNIIVEDTVVFEKEPFTLTAHDGTNYLWEPSAIFDDNKKESAVARIQTPTLITVKVEKLYTTQGVTCTNYDTINIVTTHFQIYVPSAFTPNGDLKNDSLCVYGIGVEPKIDFRVFNRWGELVFQSDDLSKCWDGKFKEKVLHMQTVGYVLEYTDRAGDKYNQKGNITIFK